DFIAGWNVTAKPLECIDSETTMPLKRCAGSGRRTRMRVLYGWPFAVPETKYSSVTQPKSAGSLPGVSAGLRPGYMGPGPVIGPSNAGTGGTTNCACAAVANAISKNAALLARIARGLADVAGAAVAQRLRIRAQRPAARGGPR